jgi:hypothetical protein
MSATPLAGASCNGWIDVASDLKWRTGFDWSAILVIVSAGAAAVLSAGVTRWLGIAIAMLAAAYMIYQYRKWNGRGWRQVHFRAMLAYAGIAGRERANSRASGRAFDLGTACTQLGLLLCGEDRKSVVDVMLMDLTRVQGAFLAGLVERHAAEVLPGAPFEFRRDVISRLRGVRLGPQLVIASVIENTHGGAEAARYAVALVTGDAGNVD